MSAHCHLLQRLFAGDIQRFICWASLHSVCNSNVDFPAPGYRQSEWHFPAPRRRLVRGRIFESGGKTRQLFKADIGEFLTFATPALPA